MQQFRKYMQRIFGAAYAFFAVLLISVLIMEVPNQPIKLAAYNIITVLLFLACPFIIKLMWGLIRNFVAKRKQIKHEKSKHSALMPSTNTAILDNGKINPYGISKINNPTYLIEQKDAQAWPFTDTPEMEYCHPQIALHEKPENRESVSEREKERSKMLEEMFRDAGIQTEVIGITRTAAFTRYELKPVPGVRVSRFASFAQDIAVSIAAPSIPKIAPVPGKSAIGVSVPNEFVDYDRSRIREAAEIIFESGQASISMLQRRMRISYARAGRIIDEMAMLGIVSVAINAEPRKLLVDHQQLEEIFRKNNI